MPQPIRVVPLRSACQPDVTLAARHGLEPHWSIQRQSGGGGGGESLATVCAHVKRAGLEAVEFVCVHSIRSDTRTSRYPRRCSPGFAATGRVEHAGSRRTPDDLAARSRGDCNYTAASQSCRLRRNGSPRCAAVRRDSETFLTVSRIAIRSANNVRPTQLGIVEAHTRTTHRRK